MTPRLREHGWEVHSGVLAEGLETLRGAFAALADVAQPLRRQLTSRDELHDRDAWGRIRNPVVVHHLPELADPLRAVLAAVVPHVRASLGPPALTQAAWAHSTWGTALHTDPHPLQPGAPLVGVKLALEDISEASGAFVVVPGSRDLDPSEPDVATWLEAARQAARAQFHSGQDPTGQAGLQAAALLDGVLERRGLTRQAVPLQAGDALLWDGALVHGSLPPQPGPRTRQSLLLHFVEAHFAG